MLERQAAPSAWEAAFSATLFLPAKRGWINQFSRFRPSKPKEAPPLNTGRLGSPMTAAAQAQRTPSHTAGLYSPKQQTDALWLLTCCDYTGAGSFINIMMFVHRNWTGIAHAKVQRTAGFHKKLACRQTVHPSMPQSYYMGVSLRVPFSHWFTGNPKKRSQNEV